MAMSRRQQKAMFAKKNNSVSFIQYDDTNKRYKSENSIKEAIRGNEEVFVHFKDGSMKTASELQGKSVYIKDHAIKVPRSSRR